MILTITFFFFVRSRWYVTLKQAIKTYCVLVEHKDIPAL